MCSTLKPAMHIRFELIVTLLFAPAIAGQGDQGENPLQGHSLRYWIKQVSSSQWIKAKEALLVLQKVGPQASAGTTAVLRATRRKEIGADAIRTLMVLGPIPKRAVQPLMKCLNKKSTSVLAIKALGSMGKDAKAARSALIRLIHAQPVRDAAFAALEQLGVDTIGLLAKDLKGKRWRSEALLRVRVLGRKAAATVPELVKVLEFYPRFIFDIGGLKSKAAVRALEKAKREFKIRSDGAAADRALTALILGEMGTPARALPALKKVAFDFNPETAKSAIWALLIHGSRVAVPVLIKKIDRRNVKNLKFLFEGLVSFGPGSERAVLTLKKLARRPGKLGEFSAKAVVEIERSLSFVKRSRSDDAKVRLAVTPRLLVYGAAGLPALVTALQIGDSKLNGAVIKLIVGKPRRFLELGAAPIKYPEIPRPLMDPVPFVPLLIEYVNGKDRRLASACCRTLAEIGSPRAEHAIPILRAVVTKADKPARVRIAGCHALLAFGSMSGVEDSNLETFLPYFRSQDARLVKECVELFGLLGVRAESCIAPLAKMFEAGEDIASNASDAIAAIGPVALPELIKSLREKSTVRRLWSVHTLGRLGERARDASPALRRIASEDTDDSVREAAHYALAKISPN